MGKFYTVMAAVMMAAAVPAQASVVEVNQPSTEMKSVSLAPVRMLEESVSQRHKAPERAPEGWNPITERPEGEARQYLRSTLTYQNYFGFMLLISTLPGTLSEWVYGDDGSVYVQNPIGGFATDSWMKGEVKDNKIVFPMPQSIYTLAGEEGDTYFNLNIMRYVPTGDNSYEMQKEDVPSEWVIKINDDGTMESDMEEGLFLAFTYEDTGEWAWYGSGDDKYSEFNYTKNELPDGLELESWALVSDNSGFLCDVAIDGENVYVMNYYTQYAGLETPIVGKIEGDKVVFQSRQFLGVVQDYVIFFFGGEIKYGPDGTPEGILYDEYVFDYDAAAKTMSSPDPTKLFVLNTNLDYMQYLAYYTAPTLKCQPSVNIVATPANPVPAYFAPFEADYGFGFFYYDLPLMSVDDEVLSPDLYFYNIFIDDEPFAITDDLNEEVEGEVYDIPFTMSWDGMYYNGTVRHNWTFKFTGFDTIGLQSFYTGGGERRYSRKMTMNCETGEYTYSDPDVTVGVDGVGESVDEVSRTYYDLTGRRVVNPAKGQILIMKSEMSDGSVRNVKTVIR